MKFLVSAYTDHQHRKSQLLLCCQCLTLNHAVHVKLGLVHLVSTLILIVVARSSSRSRTKGYKYLLSSIQAHSAPAISTANMVTAERLRVINNLAHLYLDDAENALALAHSVINRRKRRRRKILVFHLSFQV